jgi:hypothetical protein
VAFFTASRDSKQRKAVELCQASKQDDRPRNQDQFVVCSVYVDKRKQKCMVQCLPTIYKYIHEGAPQNFVFASGLDTALDRIVVIVAPPLVRVAGIAGGFRRFGGGGGADLRWGAGGCTLN